MRVVTTSSPRTLAHVQEARPDRVIDYTAARSILEVSATTASASISATSSSETEASIYSQ